MEPCTSSINKQYSYKKSVEPYCLFEISVTYQTTVQGLTLTTVVPVMQNLTGYQLPGTGTSGTAVQSPVDFHTNRMVLKSFSIQQTDGAGHCCRIYQEVDTWLTFTGIFYCFSCENLPYSTHLQRSYKVSAQKILSNFSTPLLSLIGGYSWQIFYFQRLQIAKIEFDW